MWYKSRAGYIAQDTPVDVKNSNILSVVLFKQSTLENIASTCLPFANASEFQVHYRSIIVRLKNATNELIVTVPTAFFNFKQTVAHASVNFATADEGTAAENAKTGSNRVIPVLLQEFPALQALKAYADHNGFEYSIVESNNGSIHRHPGDFSFSSIDRDKSPNEPGVIYRHLNANNAVKVDSVIYLPPRGAAKIVTTETRIVNVSESTNGIVGTYTEVPTITCILKDTSVETQIADTFDSLLGNASGEELNLPYRYVRASGATSKEYVLVTEILNQFANTTSASSADLTGVIGSNIEERTFFSYSYNKKTTASNVKVWDREVGALVEAEYDSVTQRYVPIKAKAAVTIAKPKAEKWDYTKQQWVSVESEEALITKQLQSPAHRYNDHECDYGAY